LAKKPPSRGNLRNAIARSLSEGGPDIGQIFTQLHLSARTLQRRLREAGTNFRRDLNLIRYELVLSYLRDPGSQIADIALLLGRSEHSAFARAVKKWDGRSPHKAR
jgi:AraC-like DNA-binding protein